MSITEIQGSVEYGPGSPALRLDAARLSSMAYTDCTVVAKWWETLQAGGQVADPDMADVLSRVTQEPVFLNDPQTDAQGYGIVYQTSSGPIAILAFRGTSSLADAVADAEVRLTPLKSRNATVPAGLLVHCGFLGQFLRLEEQCDNFLKQAGLKQVLCVGHSLGSSAVAIAASVYALKGFQVAYMGFGQPRPGSSKWAACFTSNVLWGEAVKHSKDPIVAIIPPVVYAHVGTPIHIGAPDPYPDLCCMWDLCDHDIAKYVACLKANNVTPETPTDWVPYIYSFAVNTPVKMYFAAKNFSFI